MPKVKQEKQAEKRFWNKFLGGSKETDVEDRALLGHAYLYKKEQQKCDRLIDKLDSEYLQGNLLYYKGEIQKIIQPKLSAKKWEEIEKLDNYSYFAEVVKELHKSKPSFSEGEYSRCGHFLKLIRHTLLIKKEMRTSLDMEQYYLIVSGITFFQQVFSHLSILIASLHQRIDEKMESILGEFLKTEFLSNQYPNAECLSSEELREAFRNLDEMAQLEILSDQKMEALVRDILRPVGLQIAKDVKAWVSDTFKKIENASAGMPSEAIFQGADVSLPREACAEEAPCTSKPSIEVEVKDMNEVCQRFKKLQSRLELPELKKQALEFFYGEN